jgi:hypothetical protein
MPMLEILLDNFMPMRYILKGDEEWVMDLYLFPAEFF